MENVQYICPCCGNATAWAEEKEKWECPFCQHVYEDGLLRKFQQASAATEAPSSLNWQPYVGMPRANIRGYECSFCGTMVEMTEGSGPCCCPQCGKAAMQARTLDSALQPDGIVPFQIDREKAQAAFRRFLRHKPLLPRRFALKKQMREMTGVFLPCWLFDCRADADLAYSATRNVTWREEKHQITRTDHFLVRRKGSMEFEGYMTDGSSRLKLGSAAGGYDISLMQRYAPEYLTGYMTVRCDQDVEEGIKRANERLEARVLELSRPTTQQYDAALLKSAHVDIGDNRIRHIWLPVWRFNGKYRQKNHAFLVNGQTGAVSGDLPVSILQCIFWSLFLGVLFAALMLGVAALIKIGRLQADIWQAWLRDIQTLLPHAGWFLTCGLAAAMPVVMRMRYHMVKDRKMARRSADPRKDGFRVEYAQDLLMYTTASRTRVEADENRKFQWKTIGCKRKNHHKSI